MKYVFATILFLLMQAAQGETNEPAWQTNNPGITHPIGPYYGYTNALAKISIEDRIREYAASGEICRALGFHCWEQIASSSNVFSLPGQGKTRKCKLCGKVETYKGEWK